MNKELRNFLTFVERVNGMLGDKPKVMINMTIEFDNHAVAYEMNGFEVIQQFFTLAGVPPQIVVDVAEFNPLLDVPTTTAKKSITKKGGEGAPAEVSDVPPMDQAEVTTDGVVESKPVARQKKEALPCYIVLDGPRAGEILTSAGVSSGLVAKSFEEGQRLWHTKAKLYRIIVRSNHAGHKYMVAVRIYDSHAVQAAQQKANSYGLVEGTK